MKSYSLVDWFDNYFIVLHVCRHIIVKYETLCIYEPQVQGAFGANEDEEEWKQNYGPIFQTSDR